MKKKVLAQILILTLLLSQVFTVQTIGKAKDNERYVNVVDFAGSIKIKRSGGEKEVSAYVGMKLYQGDGIKTGTEANTFLMLEIDDGSKKVKLGPKTHTTLSELSQSTEKNGQTTSFSLWVGKVWASVSKVDNKNLEDTHSKFEIKTSTVVMGVKGTELVMEKDEAKTTIALIEGTAALTAYITPKINSNTTPAPNGNQAQEFSIIIGVGQMAEIPTNVQTPKDIIENQISSKNLSSFVLETIKENPERVPDQLLKDIDQAIEEAKIREQEETKRIQEEQSKKAQDERETELAKVEKDNSYNDRNHIAYFQQVTPVPTPFNTPFITPEPVLLKTIAPTNTPTASPMPTVIIISNPTSNQYSTPSPTAIPSPTPGELFEFKLNNSGQQPEYTLTRYTGNEANVMIPSTVNHIPVTDIDPRVFESKALIHAITIPNTVKNIGDYCFSNCPSLESITIPNSVTYIGIGAFSNCSSIQEINIPASVVNMGSYVFNGMTSLKYFTVDPNNTSYYASTADSDGCLYDKTQKVLKYYPNNRQVNNTAATSYSIPEGVETIEGGAFNKNNTLESIAIPSTVNHIDSGTFYESSNLLNFTVNNNTKYSAENDGCLYEINDSERSLICYPNGRTASTYSVASNVTQIKSLAFYANQSLRNISLPNGLQKLESSSFMNCINLDSIIIPSTVNYIEQYAFNECIKLKKAVFMGPPPVTFQDDGFNNAASGFTVCFLDTKGFVVDGNSKWKNYNTLELTDVSGRPTPTATPAPHMVFTKNIVESSENFNSIAVSNSGIELAVGNDGLIIKLSNHSRVVTNFSENLNSITFLNGYFYAVGDKGRVIKSTDGSLWSAVDLGVTTNLNCIYQSNDRAYIVGDAGVILMCTNGSDWNKLDTITYNSSTVNMKSIAYAPDRSTFIAVGKYGVVANSQDGISWTTDILRDSNNNTYTQNLNSVSAFEGEVYIAGDLGLVFNYATLTKQTLYDNSGNQYLDATSHPYEISSNMKSVFCYGNWVVAVGENSRIYTFYADSQAKWIEHNTSVSYTNSNVSFNGVYARKYPNHLYFYIVGSDKNILIGVTQVVLGVNQLSLEINMGINNRIGYNNIAFEDSTYYIASDDGIRKSTNISSNVSTTNLYSGLNSKRSAVVVNTDLVTVGNTVVVGATSGGTNYTSTDLNQYYHDVIHDGSNFIAVGNATAVVVYDGMNLTPVTSLTGIDGTLPNFYGITNNGISNYVVGSNGLVGKLNIVSTSGNFTTESSSTSDNLRDIAFGSGYVAVGDNGTIIYKPNDPTTTWTKVTVPGLSQNLHAVTWDSDRNEFIAVGDGGIILYSSDGLIWTMNGLVTSENLYGILFDSTNHKLIIVGDHKTILYGN